jgi:hypothetical protein
MNLNMLWARGILYFHAVKCWVIYYFNVAKFIRILRIYITVQRSTAYRRRYISLI